MLQLAASILTLAVEGRPVAIDGLYEMGRMILTATPFYNGHREVGCVPAWLRQWCHLGSLAL